jgi:hypothetical protein
MDMKLIIKVFEKVYNVRCMGHADTYIGYKNELRFMKIDSNEDANLSIITEEYDDEFNLRVVRFVKFVKWVKTEINYGKFMPSIPSLMDMETLATYSYDYLMDMGDEGIEKELKKMKMETKLLR